MKIQRGLALDPKIQAALKELAALISQHYPDASFRVSRGEDNPAIIQLVTTVDLEDTDVVHDVVMERVLALHDQDLPIFVVTERPLERTFAMREAAQAQRRVVVPTP